MRIFLFVASLSIVFLFSCSSPQDGPDVIDYSSLEKLSGKLVSEIGESEDYIPGHITDLEVTRDGTILVGDMENTTIEQFDSDGKYIGNVARAGRGPGELSNIFTLHLLNGDTLIARNRTGRKEYFARTEGGGFNHINTTVQSNHTTRSLDIVKPIAGDKFYAVKNNLASHYNELEDPKATINEAFVVVDESEKVLDDSVHVLKRRGRYSVELKDGGYISSGFPFQINEQVVPLEDENYLVARPDSSAFFVYNEEHNLERRITVNVKERPVTQEDLEYKFDGLPDEAISRVNNMRSDTQPPYTKVFASGNYFWLLTEESKAGKEVVVLDFDGAPVGKFMLPVYDRISHVEDGRIYTINHNPDRGYQIRIYEIDLI